MAELRARKHREDKPFALMAPGLAAARGSPSSARSTSCCCSSARGRSCWPRAARTPPWRSGGPALARARRDAAVLAPASRAAHRRRHDARDDERQRLREPIAYRDEDAVERLAGIADLFLVHDRPIETRTDDSVVRVVGERPLMLRRSRGHVPDPLPLPLDCGRRLLACGAELKNTFALAKGAAPGWDTTSATSRTTRRCARSRPASTTSSGCSRSSRRWSRTTCTRSTCPRSTRANSRAWRRRRSSTITPTSPRAWPSTVSAAGGGRDLRRHGLRPRRDRLGRGAARRRARRLRARRPALPRPDAGRRRRRPPAVADGVRLAGGVARRAARAPADPAREGRRRGVAAGRRARPHRDRLAPHHERRAAVRCRGRAVRHPRGGQLRGPGGDRARGVRGPATRPGRTLCPCSGRATARW